MVNLIRLKLVNFIGIYLGTGLKEFEIDRSKSNNNIILIIGHNGSGKTSLISELTPLPLEHIGARNKSRIIPNTIGVKELDYLVDNYVLYKIKIVYDPSKTTKCYITKHIDGKEIDLNPNGNVESYLDVIEHELHMKKNYTNVGFLCGNNDKKNFVAMSPTERNNYISEWMPEISEFLNAYKLTGKLLTKLKKDIENYNKQIGNISSINYELELNFLNSNIENVSKQIKDIDTKIIQLNTYQEQLRKNVRDYRDLNDFKVKYLQNCEKMSKKFDILVSKYQKLNNIDPNENYEETLDKLEKDLETLKSNLAHCEQTINILSSEISSNESLLSKDEKINDTDLETILSTVEQNKEILKNLSSSISDMDEKYGSYISFEELKELDLNYDNLMNFVNTLDSKFLFLNNFVSLDSIKDMDDLSKNIDIKQKEYEKVVDIYETTKNKLTVINNEIYKYEHNNLNDDILMKRPNFCAKHQCGIIDELMKYLNPKENLGELYNTSKELQNEVIKYQEQKENLENTLKDYKKGFDYFKEIIDYLYKNNDLISKLPNLISDYFLKEPSSIYIQMNEIKLLIKELNEYSSLVIKHDEIMKSIDDMENIKTLVTTNKMIQDKLNNLVSKYETELLHKTDYINSITDIESRINMYKNIKGLLSERDNEFENYNNNIEKLKNMKNNLVELNKCTYIYNSNKNYIDNTLMTRKTELEKELSELNKKRDEMTTFYISKRQIEKMRTEVQEQFNKINILNKIWSPKVGYPSWKIESFLNDLTIKTNDDMTTMWGSNLKIKEFKLDSSDFSIVMNRDGTEIKDASLCSGAETETVNTAISFSIIESNIANGGYDVLRLDEVDAALDETRRSSFIDMIQNRINEMNCDSCFIITHNGEFENIPCDIILLKGAELSQDKLRNKNILYKYE